MIRLLSGLVLLALVASVAWFAPPAGLLALAVVVAALAGVELARLSRALGASTPSWAAAVAAGAGCAAAGWPGASLAAVLMVVIVAAGCGALAAGAPDRARLAGAAVIACAPLYPGLPLGGLVHVRWTLGLNAAVLLLLVVVASDTSQYYVGRLFGRRPLARTISPKKTVEGALGGALGGTLVLVWLGALWLPQVPLAARVMLGLLLVAAGIAGDLFESALKRAASMKDSSSLIPGHGGVLDRIDALLFAAAVYVAVLRYGYPQLP